ncbi:Putative inner membrane protein [Salmonella bongori]|nr:Putative inner membrane protein [Salmonella bongori]
MAADHVSGDYGAHLVLGECGSRAFERIGGTILGGRFRGWWRYVWSYFPLPLMLLWCAVAMFFVRVAGPGGKNRIRRY